LPFPDGGLDVPRLVALVLTNDEHTVETAELARSTRLVGDGEAHPHAHPLAGRRADAVTVPDSPFRACSAEPLTLSVDLARDALENRVGPCIRGGFAKDCSRLLIGDLHLDVPVVIAREHSRARDLAGELADLVAQHCPPPLWLDLSWTVAGAYSVQ